MRDYRTLWSKKNRFRRPHVSLKVGDPSPSEEVRLFLAAWDAVVEASPPVEPLFRVLFPLVFVLEVAGLAAVLVRLPLDFPFEAAEASSGPALAEAGELALFHFLPATLSSNRAMASSFFNGATRGSVKEIPFLTKGYEYRLRKRRCWGPFSFPCSSLQDPNR